MLEGWHSLFVSAPSGTNAASLATALKAAEFHRFTAVTPGEHLSGRFAPGLLAVWALAQQNRSMTFPRSAEQHLDKLGGRDTIVSYPRGDTSNTGIVLHVEQLLAGAGDEPGERWAVVLDTTCCHPVDAAWPDQGPDRAVLQFADSAPAHPDHVVVTRPILDCVVAASDGKALHFGSDIPVRKGTDGWAFVVAHIVGDATGIVERERVEVIVDEAHRTALSIGHTACHLASLALNRAVADRWSKESSLDALDQPNFDAAAIESSRIVEYGSTDVYRLNKSLRRKGFNTENLAEALASIEAAINATLAEWVATAAPVHVESDGPLLTDRRHWVCELPEGTASIPCGGTHAHSLAELGTVKVSLAIGDVDGTAVLTMTTAASAS